MIQNIHSWKYNQNNVELELEDGKIFRIEKFRILYGCFDQQGNGIGKIYERQLDEKNNSKFDIREGDFQNYKLCGQGALYRGKSRQMDKQGNWDNNKFISSNPRIKKMNIINENHNVDLEILNEFKQYIEQNVNYQLNLIVSQIDQKYQIFNNNNNFNNSITKIKEYLITIKLEFDNLSKLIDNNIINIKQKEVVNQNDVEIWCKYDQNIKIKDLQILNSQEWMNSSILDAYATSLNIQDEQRFWLSQDKQKYERCFIFPSYIMTQYIANKYSIESIKEYLLEYEGINYQIGRVFKHICFIINQKNLHWLLLRVDPQDKIISIYDGLNQTNQIYRNICQYVQQFSEDLWGQKIQYTQEISKVIPKQRNTYECGIMVCIYAKWISEEKRKRQLFCEVPNMYEILFKTISNEK